jgi:hypothetical protein
MGRRVRGLAAVTAATMVLAGPGLAGELGPGGGFEIDDRSRLAWTPARCARPVPPAFVVSDAQSLAVATDLFDSYVVEVQAFLDCVAREAEADQRSLARALSEGVAEARAEALEDLRDAAVHLELLDGGFD